jgi:prepilin peptidase CpaA
LADPLLKEPFLFSILGLILFAASITDIWKNKVYNWLTFPAMALGLILNMAAYHWSGLGFSALGLVVGGLIFLPAYLWGGMGAGDIKLLAVIGAFMGTVFVINTALYSALAGGAAAVVILAVKGELGRTLVHLWRVFASRLAPGRPAEPLARTHPMPYAAVIAAGAVAAYFLPPLLILP